MRNVPLEHDCQRLPCRHAEGHNRDEGGRPARRDGKGFRDGQADSGSTFTFTVLTPDSAKTVVDWYKGQLTAKGWTISSAATMESDGKASAQVSAKKGKMDAILAATPDSSDGSKLSLGFILSVKK